MLRGAKLEAQQRISSSRARISQQSGGPPKRSTGPPVVEMTESEPTPIRGVSLAGLSTAEMCGLALVFALAVKISFIPMFEMLMGGSVPGLSAFEAGAGAGFISLLSAGGAGGAGGIAAAQPAVASPLGAKPQPGGGPAVVHVILLGAGAVGRAVTRQVLALRSRHERDLNVQFKFVALVDSSGRISAQPPGSGLDDFQLDRLLSAKNGGARLSSVNASELDAVSGEGNLTELLLSLPGPLLASTMVVDCSASGSPALGEQLRWARRAGVGLVTANKKFLTGSQHLYDALRGQDGRARYEATVGAGLPVIGTLRRLLNSGDQVVRIEGIVSGTLGFIFSGLDNNMTFSEVVRAAMAGGLSEPDPREDLSGMDVARKGLIIARELGWAREITDIAVDPLLPEDLQALSVDDFLASLPALDKRYDRHYMIYVLCCCLFVCLFVCCRRVFW